MQLQYAVIEQLQEQVEKLSARVEEMERISQRQAAPFRRREKLFKAEEGKKSPGQEKGHPGSFRTRPPEVDFDEEVRLEACPLGGGEVEELEMVEHYVEEIPRLRPLCWRIRTWQGYGRCYKREVCYWHPMQVSEASGKAEVHLGRQCPALVSCPAIRFWPQPPKGLSFAPRDGGAENHARRPGSPCPSQRR